MSAKQDSRTEPAAVADPAARQDRPSVMTRMLMAVVMVYRRFVSPLLPPRCRFEPSCSAYALEALRVHGAARGLGLAVWRVARCHPFNPGGYDPVPPRGTRRSREARRARTGDRKPSGAGAWTGPLSTEEQGS